MAGGAHGPPDREPGLGVGRIEGDPASYQLVERLAPAAAFPLADLPQQTDPRHQVDVVVDGVRRPAHPLGEIAHGERGRLGELAEDLETERRSERLALFAGDTSTSGARHGIHPTGWLKIVKIF
jgi:hypothetical protein